MQKFSNPAVVLGAGGSSGLAAVRSLGRAGVTVYHVGEERTIVNYSKYCSMSVVYPETDRNKLELKRTLQKLRRKGDEAAVIFPASDSYALLLSDLVNELPDSYLSIAEKEVIELLINKSRFYDSVKARNVAHPTTLFPSNLSDLREVRKEMSFPVFIKPYLSFQFAKRFHAKGFIANSEAQLLRYFTILERARMQCMIQEIVPGPPSNHFFLDGYLDSSSNPRALFARRRIRMWPLDFGNSSLCVSVRASEMTPAIRMLLEYLKSIGYAGLFNAEFKMDQQNRVFKLLEVNPRTSAWFSTLSAMCGVDIMLVAYLDAIGRSTRYVEDYEAGAKWIHLEDDIRSSVSMFVKGDLSIREWVDSLRGKRNHLVYARDDLGPFIIRLQHSVVDIGKWLASRNRPSA